MNSVTAACYYFFMILDDELKMLESKAEAIRETIINMLVEAKSGHTAGPLGMADIFAALYFHVLKHDPKNPDWSERDRLILSNGHIVPVRYAAMAHAGYFPVEECLTLRKFGSRLQGHPERARLPGLETTSGPLGEGLSQGNGIAYALRMDAQSAAASGGDHPRVYVAMGDGEQDEGNVWEAVMWAAKNKLHNLTAIIDRNNIQIDGMTEDIMPLESLRAKYEAFNWHVIEVDGHNIRQFIEAVDESKAIYERPTVIIAHTIPGKGVPEIEFDYRWHGKAPSAEEAKKFLNDIRTMYGRVPEEFS
jgi:transketolase